MHHILPNQLNSSFRNLAHRLVAALLLIPALPVFILFYVLMKIIGRQKESFIYKGERLGRNKVSFNLYKIRTLPGYADTVLTSELFRPGHDVELQYGKFLRKTRIDELPQLINVIKGDMNMVGPRPVRPALARRFSPSIPGYDRRFSVRPGLAGYSQLLTAHRAPKRIRAALDNHFVVHHSGLASDFGVLAITCYRVLRRTLHEIISGITNRLRIYRVHGNFTNQRALTRVTGKDIYSCITPDNFDTSSEQWHGVGDLDYHALRLTTKEFFDIGDCISFVLRKQLSSGKRKTARCEGVVFTLRDHHEGDALLHEYVVFYTPETEFSRYIVDQYMLDEKI